MSYEQIKKELETLVHNHYRDGTPIMDIRAALRVSDLTAEQFGALELMEAAKKMNEQES